jgi:hypothetical protein
MTSKELNEKIYAICDAKDLPYEAFGGKAIPYIGWFWRNVDFDKDYCLFGMIPGRECPNNHDCDRCMEDCDGPETLNKPVVGFMENNKWDYNYIRCDGADWITIKELLVKAVRRPSYENFKAVNEKIQGLLKQEES